MTRTITAPLRRSVAAHPDYDPLALTFAIDDPRAISHAMTGAMGPASSELGAVERVLREVEEQKATIRTIFPADHGDAVGTDRLRLTLSREGSSKNAKLAGVQLLRLEGPLTDDARRRVSAWKAALETDRRVAYVQHPMVALPVLDRTSRDRARVLQGRIERPGCQGQVQQDCNKQWGLRQCGFDCVWDELDVGDDPGRVAILDIGRKPESAELEGRVVKYVSPTTTPVGNSHPAAVAAIISAIRDGTPNERMLGCCSAELEVYNIYTEKGPDAQVLYETIDAVGRAGVRVVNMSFESPHQDPTVNRIIDQYASQGTIFVAAMGNTGDDRPNWPAAHPAVIAVGATRNTNNDRWESSCTGKHIFMTAPGVDILTLNIEDSTRFHCEDGTSMAAPHVSAAAWLALRKRPDWGPKEIRCLLEQSVQVPNQPWNDKVGFGCLDVRRMADLLRDRVCD